MIVCLCNSPTETSMLGVTHVAEFGHDLQPYEHTHIGLQMTKMFENNGQRMMVELRWMKVIAGPFIKFCMHDDQEYQEDQEGYSNNIIDSKYYYHCQISHSCV